MFISGIEAQKSAWDKVCVDVSMQIQGQIPFELISAALEDLSNGVKVKVKDFVMDSPVIAINCLFRGRILE